MIERAGSPPPADEVLERDEQVRPLPVGPNLGIHEVEAQPSGDEYEFGGWCSHVAIITV